MTPNVFDRSEHLYTSKVFDEVIKDTVKFFNATPTINSESLEKFSGTGVYALYYVGKNDLYATLASLNHEDFVLPIYVGKAVPAGWRQARNTVKRNERSYELHRRLEEHKRSISLAYGLNVKDFYIRFMILENHQSDLIGTVEAALIREYRPLWNTVIDGFGNHDPGKGRYNQAKSDWDVLHKGRLWAEKCKGTSNVRSYIVVKCKKYFEEL